MWNDEAREKNGSRGTLARLRSDTGGNTLAIMAAALIPMAALVGSGVDTARTYVVKSRLQQACDAGVLAGRKAMQPSPSTTLETPAAQQATAFFDNNFERGWLGTSNVTFVPSKTDQQQVFGTASATVPMTIMRMFDANNITLTVTCEARFDLADSDVMFVLDVTGSMACTPEASTCNPPSTSYTFNGETRYTAIESTGSRMAALREAVVDFDTTMRSNADPSTRIRYGFVPYSSNVNVGGIIPAQHMVRTKHTYQSRVWDSEADINTGSWATATEFSTTNCASAGSRTPSTNYTTGNTATYVDTRINSGTCQRRTREVRVRWRFEPVIYNLSEYYNTLASNGTVLTPARYDNSRSRWRGCIEERQTTTASSFDFTNLPPDLNPDLIPTSDDTRWKPHWPDVVWGRNYNPSGVTSSNNDNYFETTEISGVYPWAPYAHRNRTQNGFSACPPPARRLAQMTSAQVSAYVNAGDFRPHGGTYHDIGMIWGVRMLSPNGIFAADTAPPPGRPSPQRNIVFMTDGQMAPNVDVYGAYGLQRYDDRIGGGSNITNVRARHNARFLEVCKYARERLNIRIWVVALSTGLNDDLRACATPGNHAFTASSKTELQNAFKRIAQEVAMLRIDK